jgi:hypothetical protein
LAQGYVSAAVIGCLVMENSLFLTALTARNRCGTTKKVLLSTSAKARLCPNKQTAGITVDFPYLLEKIEQLLK